VNAVAVYLDRLHEIHASKRGTPELSYRTALENLLNSVGHGLDPAVQGPADPEGAVDVYLNDRVFWANVPADVWAMTIGGYPVLKKWLSYREFKVLGRALREEEMTYFTEVVRRLKALLLLGADLDANYRTAAAKTLDLPWPAGAAGRSPSPIGQ
jgi:hypothetical protein